MPHPLTLDTATRILHAALAHSEALGLRMNVAVVDAGGNLVTFARMDGAFFGSVSIAIDKAWTSTAFQCPTADLAALTHPDGPAWGLHHTNQGRVTVFGGGLPLLRAGKLVGAIGVSGGSVEQDIDVAEAGALAL